MTFAPRRRKPAGSRGRHAHGRLSRGLRTAASIIPVFCGCALGIAAEIMATDGSLVQETVGIIYDTDTGLEWYPGPDRGMTWQDARDWVARLEIRGPGWRMPERHELPPLRRIGDGIRNLTPLIPSTGYWIWAGQTREAASRWLFGFGYGGEGWSGQAPEDGGRAVAVRVRRSHD